MSTPSVLPRRASAIVPLAAIAIAIVGGALGCEQSDEITSYENRRTEPWVTAVDPDEERANLDHMFAAVVPGDGVAWFFKLVVPGADAEAMREPFDKFLASVDVSKSIADAGVSAGDGAKDEKPVTHPAWDLPEGWTEEPGGAMRAATIVIPHAGKRYEITVSSLPLSGKWDDYLKLNVNRWMGQLQEPPLAAATIKKLGRKVPTEKGDATRFELVGTMRQNPMGGGLAGMPAGHPPISERTPEEPADEAAKPAAEQQPAEPAVDEKLTYDAPATWEAQPLGGGMFPREASFKIKTDEGQAELAVTKFSEFGQMAALGPNVRRWAGQVGVVDLTEDDILEAAHRVTLDGEPALQFEFFSPDGNARPQGILAVMAKRGGMVWFFKLFGDKATVESQRDAFDAFLKSARFQVAS